MFEFVILTTATHTFSITVEFSFYCSYVISPLPVFHRRDFRLTIRPCVHLSDCLSVRPQNPDPSIT